ncbi:MAG: hypothetical protein Q6366_007340 [Candidatus Freyarchaeota archaeon]
MGKTCGECFYHRNVRPDRVNISRDYVYCEYHRDNKQRSGTCSYWRPG